MKLCKKCGEKKPLTEFYKHKYTSDGHRSTCKECDKKTSRKWDKANPGRKKERQRKWREANPESNRKWRENNPEKKRESDRKWIVSNPEKKKELNRNWDKANSEKRKVVLKRYENRKNALPDTLTSQEFDAILVSYNYLCAYCEKSWQVKNRIIPVSQGGGRTKENIVPACKSCSARKHSRTPEQAGMVLKQANE